MKEQVHDLIAQAIFKCQTARSLPSELSYDIQIERTRDASHGDLACNVAMMLAKAAKKKPRDIAEDIVAQLPKSDFVTKVEIAGPGFINFYLNSKVFYSVVPDVLSNTDQFGRSTQDEPKNIQIEFVSANPTGPLHVGHGRGAAYGAALANLLRTVGHSVSCEYYVNDAGRQMDILAASVWVRYLELAGEPIVFPVNGYQGDYVLDIAASIHRQHQDAYRHAWATITDGLPKDESEGGNKDEYIDALINKGKELLGEMDYRFVFERGLNYILDDIRDDLEHFGVTYDMWFSERSLMDSGAIQRALDTLESNGHTYEEDGAIWFASSKLGDDKDRVLVRDNGQTTYFASDVAYHMDKFDRGFDQLIDIWGSDHHGYVPRVRAAVAALGGEAGQIEVLLAQFVTLYRGTEKIQMSTRSGDFVTLRQLRKDVGKDAARFYYVMRRCEQHLDFDLELAKKQSKDNPLYYIQYAHARICTVLSKAEEKGMAYNKDEGLAQLECLTEEHELSLMSSLTRYPEMIQNAADKREPHQVVQYLKDLAAELHTYYDADDKRIVILNDDSNLRNARLSLVSAVRQVIANGLGLLGVNAPNSM